jgi:hypothetical protein
MFKERLLRKTELTEKEKLYSTSHSLLELKDKFRRDAANISISDPHRAAIYISIWCKPAYKPGVGLLRNLCEIKCKLQG